MNGEAEFGCPALAGIQVDVAVGLGEDGGVPAIGAKVDAVVEEPAVVW